MATYGCIDCRRCAEHGYYICDCDKPGRLVCDVCRKRCSQRHGATCDGCSAEFVRCEEHGGVDSAWEALRAHKVPRTGNCGRAPR